MSPCSLPRPHPPEGRNFPIRIHFDQPSTVRGTLRAPASKSYTHRAYLTAALVRGGTVHHPLDSADTNATLDCLEGFNGALRREASTVHVEADPPTSITTRQFNASESGTLLRFLIPVCTVVPGPREVRLVGEGSLRERSNRSVVESIRENGFQIEATGEHSTVPITCRPGQSLPDQPLSVTARTTSQLVSGWMLALGGVGGGSFRIVTELVSGPYVDMTREVLKQAGVDVSRDASDQYHVRVDDPRPLDYTVPGDYSSAAFALVGASLTPGTLTVTGLRPRDPQADRRIVEVLEQQGAEIGWTDRGEDDSRLEVAGPFRPGEFTMDASQCPDLVPILTVLGCLARGPVSLRNIAHLANKESDRIRHTCGELRKIGVDIEDSADRIDIHPSGEESYRGAVLDAHNDHRLAMAFSILGTVLGGITVEGAECVTKSYPGFFEDLHHMDARFRREGQ